MVYCQIEVRSELKQIMTSDLITLDVDDTIGLAADIFFVQ
jgi:hypothetical protein